MKRKYLQPMKFTMELLRSFGESHKLTDEQAIVEEFGRFKYGKDFIAAAKCIDFKPDPFMDVEYKMVFWLEDPRDELVAPGLTFGLLEALMRKPLPREQTQNFQFPRCPQCKRRPTLTTVKGSELFVKFESGSATQDAIIAVPRYDRLPCCSAKYIKVNDGPNRKQRIAATHEKGAV